MQQPQPLVPQAPAVQQPAPSSDPTFNDMMKLYMMSLLKKEMAGTPTPSVDQEKLDEHFKKLVELQKENNDIARGIRRRGTLTTIFTGATAAFTGYDAFRDHSSDGVNSDGRSGASLVPAISIMQTVSGITSTSSSTGGSITNAGNSTNTNTNSSTSNSNADADAVANSNSNSNSTSNSNAVNGTQYNGNCSGKETCKKGKT
jgi:hypothetical protein